MHNYTCLVLNKNKPANTRLILIYFFNSVTVNLSVVVDYRKKLKLN